MFIDLDFLLREIGSYNTNFQTLKELFSVSYPKPRIEDGFLRKNSFVFSYSSKYFVIRQKSKAFYQLFQRVFNGT